MTEVPPAVPQPPPAAGGRRRPQPQPRREPPAGPPEPLAARPAGPEPATEVTARIPPTPPETGHGPRRRRPLDRGVPPLPEPEVPTRPEPDVPARPEPDVPTRPHARAVSRGERRRAERRAGRQVRHRRLRRALVVLAVLVVVAAVVTVAVALVRHNRSSPSAHSASRTPAPPTVSGARLAQPELATSFLAAAASDIAAVTTYDYRTLDDALQAGTAVTTGAYQRAYRAALTGELATIAMQNHVVHTFETLELGVGQMNAAGTQAKVLVFGRERVTDDSTKTDAQVTPATLCATIDRIGNRYLISNLVENGDAGLPPGGSDLRVAAEAGRAEVVNLLSYRRADFAADVQRAEAGAVSPLREQIQANSVGTGAGMRRGKYDLVGTVTAAAIERASGSSVVMLVAAESTRVTDGAASPTTSRLRYVVTVTRTDQGWGVSQVRSVDGT